VNVDSKLVVMESGHSVDAGWSAPTTPPALPRRRLLADSSPRPDGSLGPASRGFRGMRNL
jgi:hypothetical protein